MFTARVLGQHWSSAAQRKANGLWLFKQCIFSGMTSLSALVFSWETPRPTSVRHHISPGTSLVFGQQGSRGTHPSISINWKAQVEASMTESFCPEPLIPTSSSTPLLSLILASDLPVSLWWAQTRVIWSLFCLWLQQFRSISRVYHSFVLWHPAVGRIEDRALSQHSEAAAARSWFKPLPNQGSTFISCCHYSPATLWQMALWDIGFYGRSSFISNFFSHLMRSSRSSQIQFAVWILIGLCSLSFSHLLVLHHSLFLYRHLLQVSSDLMGSCSWRSVWDASACLWCTAQQHKTKKIWINMKWI